MALEICADCERTFEAQGPNSFLCPKCRKARLSQGAKDRKLYMLGAAAHSQSCKKRKEGHNEAD